MRSDVGLVGPHSHAYHKLADFHIKCLGDGMRSDVGLVSPHSHAYHKLAVITSLFYLVESTELSRLGWSVLVLMSFVCVYVYI